MTPPPPPPPPRPPPRPQGASNFAPLPPPPMQSQTRVSRTRNVGISTPSANPSRPPPQQPTATFPTCSTPSSAAYEPYGEVSVPAATSTSTPTGLAHRRSNDIRNEAITAASTTAAGPASGVTAPAHSHGYGQGVTSSYAVPLRSYPQQQKSKNTDGGEKQMGMSNQYQHNIASLCFLIPSLASILWWHESSVILQVFLFYILIVYAMDLMNTRDGMAVFLWLGAPVMSMVSGFGTLLQAEDAEATGGAMILYLVQLAVEGLMFVSISCLGTLQFKWLYKETPSIAIGMERALHSVLPPVSASILTYHAVRQLFDYWGLDRVATLTPHIFAALLASGMATVSSCPASFEPLPEDPQQNESSSSKGHRHQQQPSATSGLSTASASPYSISIFSARVHSILLLMIPGMMHLLMFRRRIFSRYAAFDEIFDIILVWAVPYLLHCAILTINTPSLPSPYTMSSSTKASLLFPQMGQTSLRGAILPMIISLAASVAFQQRYLIPLCQSVSYQFNGHDLSSVLVVTLYLTVATLFFLFALWTWGRTSTETNELLFGEYHDDVVQLCVSGAGLCLGKACGLPWNLTPLPILAFLGLSVWITTRMLRYLCIFLFVVHAAGIVIFSYRFAAIDISVPLAIPGIPRLGLIRFGMAGVIASVLIGLVAGFAVRPAGGLGASVLKRIDLAGFLAITYCIILTTMELTLLKRPVPNQELWGKESDVGSQDEEFVYDHATAFLTSILVIVSSIASHRLKAISYKSAMATCSIMIGKAIATLIDANEVDGKALEGGREEAKSQRLFFRAMVTSLLLLVMLAPHSMMKPIHIKLATRYKRSISNGKPLAEIPVNAYRMILIYSLVILPATLVITIPFVLTPLVKALSAHYGGGAYYSMPPPLSEMAGVALALWGIATLSMLNHFLPDGGGEAWKKSAALTLLMGVGVAISAPTVPEFILTDSSTTGVSSSPYASISSLGTRLMYQQSRTGGWGILAASLATLLAVTGPLELRERRPPTGRKDKYFLLRLMIFSITFGSGVSWFLAIQSMSQEHVLVLIVTVIGCMVVSFFGTVACVLGYTLELENFDEVDQIARVWVGAFLIFGCISGAPQLILSAVPIHAFGTGGWLSTYLFVSCLVTLALSCSLKARKTKNQATRKLANLCCVAAWVFAILVLYGQYGVAGIDDSFVVTHFAGMPASILGTILVAPIVLALEGEEANERRGRIARVSGTNAKAPVKTMGLTINRLNASNRLVPLFIGTVSVFIAATLYTIFLRGSFLFEGARVAKSHTDVFHSMFGNQGDELSKMAERAVSHSQALVTSARLAGSGFWTSDNILGPLIHLGGLVATVPNLYLLLSQQWFGLHITKVAVTFALPLNVIPVVICKGIPALRVLGVLVFVSALVQLMALKRNDRRSQMRI